MTFDTLEKSVHGGRPREIYTFELLNVGTWHLTTSKEDEVYSGTVYTSTPGLARGNVKIEQGGNVREIQISMPITHAVVASLLANGIGPREPVATVERVHWGDGDIRRIWRGHIVSIETDDETARLTVASAIDSALQIRLPIILAQRSCPHVLYDVGCGFVRSGFNTTVLSFAGTTITLADDQGHPDGDLKHGEIVRVNDNEKRTILSHLGDVIIIDVPFTVLANGDTVNLAPGCDKTIETCDTKFGNVANYGGQPLMKTTNPSGPTNVGIQV